MKWCSQQLSGNSSAHVDLIQCGNSNCVLTDNLTLLWMRNCCAVLIKLPPLQHPCCDHHCSKACHSFPYMSYGRSLRLFLLKGSSLVLEHSARLKTIQMEGFQDGSARQGQHMPYIRYSTLCIQFATRKKNLILYIPVMKTK